MSEKDEMLIYDLKEEVKALKIQRRNIYQFIRTRGLEIELDKFMIKDLPKGDKR